jgi:hypothetical protein
VSEYGKGSRPPAADKSVPHTEAAPYKGGSADADKAWAQNRIANFLRAQSEPVMRKADPGHADKEGHADKAAVSQPGEPAEKEADAVADHVAGELHSGGDKADAASPKEAPAPIAAKLDGSVVHRMPKWNEGDKDEEGGKEKGKSFRGGKKKDRDNWYGFDDPNFQNWWHREGKQAIGNGKDLDNRQQAQAAYSHWVSIGKPRGGK